jgi:hypothetical protein
MPANEIENRLAAAAWIGVEPANGADPPPSWTLSLRAQVSCRNQLIIGSPDSASVSWDELPLVIVPLDRELSRRETTLHVCSLANVAAATRDSEPALWFPTQFGYDETNVESDTRIMAMAIHMDWIGPLESPVWLPFGVGTQSLSSVAAGFNLDIYNAVALLWPLHTVEEEASYPVGSDVCFHIWQHPPVPDTQTTIIDTLYVQGAL